MSRENALYALTSIRILLDSQTIQGAVETATDLTMATVFLIFEKEQAPALLQGGTQFKQRTRSVCRPQQLWAAQTRGRECPLLRDAVRETSFAFA